MTRDAIGPCRRLAVAARTGPCFCSGVALMVAAGASRRDWTAPSVNVWARSDAEGPIPRPALPGTSLPDQSQLPAAATPTKASARKKHALLRPHSSDRQFEGGRYLSGDAHQEHRLGHIGTDKLPSPSSKHRGQPLSKASQHRLCAHPITSSIDRSFLTWDWCDWCD